MFQNTLKVSVKATTNVDCTKQLLKWSEDTDDMACVQTVTSVYYDIYKEVLYKEYKVLWKRLDFD